MGLKLTFNLIKMIDTVHLIIRDLRDKPALMRVLQQYQKVQLSMPKQPNIKSASNGKYMHYFDTDRTLIGMKQTFKIENSRTGSLTFIIDESRDTVLFNYSIPKYYYKTNVFQFLSDKTNDIFFTEKNNELNYQITKSYELFLRHLLHFKKTILHDTVNIVDIELKRIDFCYNLICESEQHKYYYFTKLKTLSLKGFKHSTNYQRSSGGDNTIFWKSKRQSFKIYDKYDEFITNDAKQVKLTTPLIEFSKRIIRFEWTLRDTYLNDIYLLYHTKRFNHSLYNDLQDLIKYQDLAYQRKQEIKRMKDFLNKLRNNRKSIIFTKQVDYLSHTSYTKDFHQYLLLKFKSKLQVFVNDNIKVEVLQDVPQHVERFHQLYLENNSNYEQLQTFFSRTTYFRLKKLHKEHFNNVLKLNQSLSYQRYFQQISIF